jgi:hypothetical protein
LDIPDPNSGTEMKSGWISRKHCCGPGGKKSKSAVGYKFYNFLYNI